MLDDCFIYNIIVNIYTTGCPLSKLFVFAQFVLRRIYYERDTSKIILGKIIFKFCTINSNVLSLISNKSYRPNIGTVDDAVLWLMALK